MPMAGHCKAVARSPANHAKSMDKDSILAIQAILAILAILAREG
jgi:hypothetical protein